MPSPYSLDLRVRIVAAYEDGMSVDELAEQFRVGRSTIYTYLNQFQETGNVAPKVYQPGRKKKLAPYEAEVRQLVADYPDATLADFCEKLSPQVSVSTATMCEFLRYLKITRKKKTLRAAEQHREDVVKQRSRWQWFMDIIDMKKLVFIDETWAKTNMTPLYGWAEIGKRVIDYVPHGHWKTTTFIAALRYDRLTAPMVIDGAINGELFLAYVKQELVKTLTEGDIVVMDNLSSHKVAGVKEAIESVGARVIYLPPYSPDFNPIEMVFSKLKTLLRKLKLRTMEELWEKLGKLCDVFSSQECQNYFRHAGYKNMNVQTNS